MQAERLETSTGGTTCIDNRCNVSGDFEIDAGRTRCRSTSSAWRVATPVEVLRSMQDAGNQSETRIQITDHHGDKNVTRIYNPFSNPIRY